MPRLTGVQFVEQQIMQGCKNTNVALMSGNWSESDLRCAHELGCQVFHKPFKLSDLQTWFNECETKIDSARELVSLATGILGIFE